MRAPRWARRAVRAARPTRAVADELTDEEKLQLVEWLLRELPEEERARARGVVFAHLRETHTMYGFPVPEWIRLGEERNRRQESG